MENLQLLVLQIMLQYLMPYQGHVMIIHLLFIQEIIAQTCIGGIAVEILQLFTKIQKNYTPLCAQIECGVFNHLPILFMMI